MVYTIMLIASLCKVGRGGSWLDVSVPANL